MRAIILAAGSGTRLNTGTQQPKCLVELRGRPMIEHQFDILSDVGIKDIHVIAGYLADRVVEALPPGISCHNYPQYTESNNLWTLAAHTNLVQGDTLILFSDVLFTRKSIYDLVNTTQGDVVLLADGRHCREGTMRVISKGERLLDIGNGIDVNAGDGNFIGISKINSRACAHFTAALKTARDQEATRKEYYTTILPELANQGLDIFIQWLRGERWLEIDDMADLEAAREADFYVNDTLQLEPA